MAKLRKVFHDSEKEWLNCDSKETRREKRREYVEKRRKYKKAVSRAKRKFDEDRQVKLEKLIRSPRKWWAEVRKLGLIGGKKKDMTGRVYDEGGVIRQGKEAVEVWRSYFEKVLNEGGNSEDQGGGVVLGGESSWIDEGITREEVEQALGKLKAEGGARNRRPNSRNGWQQGVSGLLALPLQLVLGQWDDPHRMEKERNCTHTKKKSKVCVQDG